MRGIPLAANIDEIMNEEDKRKLIGKFLVYGFDILLEEWETPNEARFSLGLIVATIGAVGALQANDKEPQEYLQRHQLGDWGRLCDEDKKENERSLEDGLRILSAYRLPDGQMLWIITEADRSATTLLLPLEY